MTLRNGIFMKCYVPMPDYALFPGQDVAFLSKEINTSHVITSKRNNWEESKDVSQMYIIQDYRMLKQFTVNGLSLFLLLNLKTVRKPF